MNRLNRGLRGRWLSWLISWVVASFLLLPIFPMVEGNAIQHWLLPSAQANIFRNILERTGLYTPPRKGTAPSGRRSGGAGRGPICALPEDDAANHELMALVPTSHDAPAVSAAKQTVETVAEAQAVGGLTITEQPTFWFYVPYVAQPTEDPEQKRVAQFVLLDEQARPVWHELVAFELLNHPRLVEYPLPYPLALETLYQWSFSVICDAEKRSRNPAVRGWVQRVEPPAELPPTLNDAPPFGAYQAYISQGIWFEAMTALATTRRKFPTANLEDWGDLMDYFEIPVGNQFDLLVSTELADREVVRGSQLPARM